MASPALFPLSVGLAVLRYRLYDIDRLISRTLAYTGLTVLLGGAYLLAILVLQSILPLSDDSPLIVAASTLGVVAAFGPLRGRVQGAVDRRFNRSRYDAQQTLEGFGQSLRTHTDLDHLRTDLVSVVGRTVSPRARIRVVQVDGRRPMSGAALAIPVGPSRRGRPTA